MSSSVRDTRFTLVPFAALVLAASLARPLHAQDVSGRFDTGIVAGGDWLQGNALPFDRKAVESLDVTLGLRRRNWSLEGGWLRVARDLSTVQGASLSVGRMLHLGPVSLIPAVAGFGGEAYESRDSTGYDFVGAGGVTGHQPRYSYSSAASFGGSAQLTVEVPVYRMLGVRATVAQWYFSGAPLDGDRARTVVGAGVSLRVWR